MGERFLIYDSKIDECFEGMIQINLFGDEICWKVDDFICMRDIIDIKPGVTAQRFIELHPDLDKRLCLSVKSKNRIINMLAESKGQRNAWVAGLRLLTCNNKIGAKFQGMRHKLLKRRLKPGGKLAI